VLILNTENEAVIPRNWYISTSPTLYYQLTIINNRSYTIYYKITSQTTGITLNNNTGSIGSASAGIVMLKITFLSIPSSQDYTVNLNVELYSDSAYENLIDSGSFDLTVHFIDLNTANKIAYWNFSDGSKQGWVADGVSNTAFADPYSIYKCTTTYGGCYISFSSPSITLPSSGNIWLIFAYNGGGTSSISISFGSTNIKNIKNIWLSGGQWYIFAIKVNQGLGTTNNFNFNICISAPACGFLDNVYIVSL